MVGAPLPWITALMQHGVQEAQAALIAAFILSVFLGPHLHFDNNNTDTLGFRSDELADQWGTAILWPANHLLVVFVLRAGAKSCWKRKSSSLSIKFVSKLKHKVLQVSRWVTLLTVDLITQWINWHQHEEMTWHCRNFTLDFKHLGFCASLLFL